ncbi:MAG: prepilin peptidase, partial [Acidimicrobiales bacterium]
MTAVLAVAAGLYGLVIGSFLNVVIHRVPLHQSVVRPPSACPACESRIAPLDNIPLVSWVALRGRC